MRHQSVRSVSRAAVGVLAAATMLPNMSSPAHAEPNTAPVTSDDTVAVYATGTKLLDLLANDTDADGDDLAVCRVELSPARAVLFAAVGSVSSISLADTLRFDEDEDLGIFGEPGLAAVLAGPKARGTHRFTYYACDRTALTPATVTVTVLPAPKVTVRKVAGKPGRLRVTNPSTVPMRFIWETPTRGGNDIGRKTRVLPGASKLVRATGSHVSWWATGQRDAFSVRGKVVGIRTR
ncbi:hypothetical protein GHK92_05025 [Nocardioides sp. dk4132]|uniref:Ig-like domain-containing protein n=1 Tax=unclassified Nocardioides TaxID=2615069 RepID=UPI0012959261|nr:MULTISPECIES: Ig-like domain-containing protein [unclassified Nocardioides]MQW75229.1 hypothetical protein [Nocardioides sp. dk4132]QGA07618.1 hypothetical protein GFH29_09575 [Nocardioides sp. dk884]